MIGSREVFVLIVVMGVWGGVKAVGMGKGINLRDLCGLEWLNVGVRESTMILRFPSI